MIKTFEKYKRAVRRLEAKSFVIITQDGKRVDSSRAAKICRFGSTMETEEWIDQQEKSDDSPSEIDQKVHHHARLDKENNCDLSRNGHDAVRYANKAKTASQEFSMLPFMRIVNG